jgi:hypothetical protein
MTFRQHFQIELYKLKRPDFYIFAALCLTAFIGLPIVMMNYGQQSRMVDLVESAGKIGSIFIVYGLIVALTREFTNMTNRKRVLNGYSRQDLFISQIVVVGLYVTFVILAVIVALPIIFLLWEHDWSSYVEGMRGYKVVGSFLALLSYGILGSFLGVITGKAHWAILIYWGWGIVELAGKFLGFFAQAQGKTNIYQYFMPLNLFSQLQQFYLHDVGLLLTLVVMLMLFQGLSLFKFLKADL